MKGSKGQLTIQKHWQRVTQTFEYHSQSDSIGHSMITGFDTITTYDPNISFRIEHYMDLIKNDTIDVPASAQSRRT